MAKSLRSHKKTQHRALKRSKPSSDYAKAETSRTQRLADKLKASGLKSKVVAKKEEDEEGEGIEEEPTATMETDEAAVAAEPAKVSTSGPRASGREIWKAERNKKLRKSSGTVFTKSKRSKRDGRIKA